MLNRTNENNDILFGLISVKKKILEEKFYVSLRNEKFYLI